MSLARGTILVLGCLLAREGIARADDTLRLVYVRDAAATRECPDESALRRAIESRLGQDAFSPWGTDAVIVHFERDSTSFLARVEIVRRGESNGARTLHSDDPGCGDLVDATALAVSIALETIRASAPPVAETPAVVPETVKPPEELPVTVASSPADQTTAGARPKDEETRRSVWPTLGLDALVSLGTAPSPAPGLTAWGRLRWGHWSGALEADADLPTSTSTQPAGGTVSTRRMSAGLVPCFHLGPAFACVVGELGWLDVQGLGVTMPRSGTELFAGVGPRLGVELPISDWLSLRLRAGALANLSRSTVTLNQAVAWTAPPAFGVFAAGLAVRIP